MDIKDFVKSTITQISEAVSELNEEFKNGTIVNPSLVEYCKKTQIPTIGATVEDIQFDLSRIKFTIPVMLPNKRPYN